jgi:hypothetical protein
MTLTFWGLICDMIGVILLLIFGFPKGLAITDGQKGLAINEADPKREKIMKRMGYVGIILVLVGFSLMLGDSCS